MKEMKTFAMFEDPFHTQSDVRNNHRYERLNILVDTGARQALAIPDSIASKLKFTGNLTSGPTLSTFDTAASASLIGKLSDELSMGIHKTAGTKVHVWEDVPVLGSDLFKDFVLTFDQKNCRLRIGV